MFAGCLSEQSEVIAGRDLRGEARGDGIMLLDEYVDYRVRVGESERLRVEREQARRAREHGQWLQSLLRRRAASTGAGASAPADAATGADATAAVPTSAPTSAPVAEGAPKQGPAGERELAHAGR